MKYPVPKGYTSDRKGGTKVQFSSPLEPLSYESILQRFRNAGKLNKERILQDIIIDEDTVGYTEYQKLTQLLKLTESITLELIPGNLIDVAAKKFDWFLVDLTQSSINIKVDFLDPTAISYD